MTAPLVKRIAAERDLVLQAHVGEVTVQKLLTLYRFLVGTDPWVTSRWESLPASMREVQRWLDQLPPGIAARIAHRNGERLFPP